ncbi:hypothetical protein LOK49_LG05G02301 [Camellia lanceoleosa]|uniref:Uncharacterized protein n=1 Tax=Camellia lanceoleosa TaxID=1840588 RepID=A0ACC0HHI0_9ERIC|nr:hypothetical protein LOK49_LG05G02301 [Camellia lanceoleosa]
MAKVGKVQRKSDCRCHRVTPYPLPSHSSKVLKDVHQKKKRSKAPEIKQWDDATCSVCMEYPHNAVLLLCSSYDKGCRPYMCATSSRYSNCLEQYKKAYTRVSSTQIAEPWLGSIDESGFLGLGCLSEKTQVSELLCPLCRGQVKGWTVVEPARKYFNTKRRTCMQDNCSYVGTYKELRKHVKAEHPCACPREVDPTLAEKWKRLENEREREDVMSTIRSSMPGAIVMGDYVIERNYRGGFSGDYDVDDYLGDAIFRLESFGGGGNGHHVNSSDGLFESDHQYSWDEEEDIDLNRDANVSASGNFDDNFISRFTRYQSRLLSGRLRRRRRRRRAVNRVR